MFAAIVNTAPPPLKHPFRDAAAADELTRKGMRALINAGTGVYHGQVRNNSVLLRNPAWQGVVAALIC